MSIAYFGLICRHCVTRHPLGQELHRDLKYMLDRGPFELNCIQCGRTDLYPDMVVWERTEPYSPTQMGVERLRVRRANRS